MTPTSPPASRAVSRYSTGSLLCFGLALVLAIISIVRYTGSPGGWTAESVGFAIQTLVVVIACTASGVVGVVLALLGLWRGNLQRPGLYKAALVLNLLVIGALWLRIALLPN